MKYYRVKFGYGKDDFISVDETELQKAVSAQVTSRVAYFAEGTISGSHIIAIISDFQRELGLHRDHELTWQDYDELSPRLHREYLLFLKETEAQVHKKLDNDGSSKDGSLPSCGSFKKLR